MAMPTSSTRPVRTDLVLAAVLACTAAAPAQVVWLRRNPLTKPSNGTPVWGHTIHFELSTLSVVLFGGIQSNGTTWNQTLEWTGYDWLPRTPAVLPPGRAFHAATSLFPKPGVLVHGGQRSGLNADTWLWNGVTWASLAATGPSARRLHALAYDAARDRVVLFGGDATTNGTQPLADTWEWDGASWAQKTTPTAPSPRFGHVMCYDPGRGRVTLFGGSPANAGSMLADTWEWDGVAWQQRFPTSSPPGRMHAAVAWDPTRGRMVMQGGTGPIWQKTLADAWEYDAVGNAWKQLTPVGVGPGAHDLHGIAFDLRRGRMVMACGWNWNVVSGVNDTWELLAQAPGASATSYGSACAGSAGLPTLSAPLLPKLGNAAFTLDLASARASAPAAILLGEIPAAAPLPGGCTLLVGSPLVVLSLQTGASGTGSLPLSIPSGLELLGLELSTQAIVADPLGALSGVACLSQGLRLVLGQ